MRSDDAPGAPQPLWGPARRPGAQQLPHPGSAGSPSADPPALAADRSAPPTVLAYPARTGSPPGQPDAVADAPTQSYPVSPDSAPPTPEHSVTIGGSGQRTGLMVGLAVAALLIVTSVVVVAQQKPTSSAAAPAPAQATNSAGGVRTTEPSPTSTPAIGTRLIRVTSTAASHPFAASVAALLDRHFTAINQRDYASWSATVVAQRVSEQSQSAWLKSYRSTTDDSVVVTSISSGSTDLTVGLSFMSIQDPSDAPADLQVTRICWESQWPVVDISSGGRIRTPAKGSTTKWAC